MLPATEPGPLSTSAFHTHAPFHFLQITKGLFPSGSVRAFGHRRGTHTPADRNLSRSVYSLRNACRICPCHFSPACYSISVDSSPSRLLSELEAHLAKAVSEPDTGAHRTPAVPSSTAAAGRGADAATTTPRLPSDHHQPPSAAAGSSCQQRPCAVIASRPLPRPVAGPSPLRGAESSAAAVPVLSVCVCSFFMSCLFSCMALAGGSGAVSSPPSRAVGGDREVWGAGLGATLLLPGV